MMPIIHASEKYIIPGLSKVCMDYLEETIHTNACICYDHSLLYGDKDLATRCLILIKSKTSAWRSQTLVYVRQSTLSTILDSDEFVVSELDVFKACDEWARYQVKKADQKVNGKSKRNVLGDCVTKIRFPTMTAEELGTHVSPKGILLPEEELALFKYVSNKERKVSPPPMFKTEKRNRDGRFYYK